MHTIDFYCVNIHTYLLNPPRLISYFLFPPNFILHFFINITYHIQFLLPMYSLLMDVDLSNGPLSFPEITNLQLLLCPSKTNNSQQFFSQILGICELLVPQCWEVDWLDLGQVLVRQPWLLCVHECNDSAMSRRHLFGPVLCDLSSLQCSCPIFCKGSLEECNKDSLKNT